MSELTRRATRTGSKSTTGSTKCIFCDTKIDKDKRALQCDNCRNWVCLECSKIPEALYTELVKCTDNDIDWSCRVCKSMKADLKNISAALVDLKTTSETRLTRVEDRLANLEDSVKDTVKAEVDCAKTEIVDSVKSELACAIEDIVEKRVKEIEDRKNRSANLIIFKLKMSDDPEPLTRKSHDIDTVKKLYSLICPEKGELEIRTCFRLGKQKNPDGDPPPLKVILNSKEQRRNLLLASKNITGLSDEMLKVVIVVRDLTVEQRKGNKAVESERRQRSRNGENVTIRHGQVVERSSEGASSSVEPPF